ncbi:MAG: DUF3943 domain-containing protein [Prevotellaceae bacterium]|jgi:hypothetical protein|nr:DUF3943 domain-containing protein [Prevotellaceae bacterium]
MLFRKYIVAIVISFMFGTSLFAQFSLSNKSLIAPVAADSVDIEYYKNKNWGSTTAQVLGLNAGVWAFNRYVMNTDYARISWQSVRDNFRHGYVWDNDQMGTNLFLHPYTGGLYYNSARANGFNMWQSSLYVMLGSNTWELFLENEYPSINDGVNTTLGGVMMGEVFYRTSDFLLDDRATGFSRFGRELAALIISPTRGFTRLIRGDAWRVRQTSGRQFGSPNINTEVSVGIRNIELRDDIFDEGFGVAADVALEYGERFETDGWKPYDYFTFKGSVNLQKSQPFLEKIIILGRLYGTELIDSKKDYLNFGVYQHFSYYDSDTISDISSKVPYKFGTSACVGIGLMYNCKRLRNWNLNAYAHLNAVILGASLSDHYSVGKRNYNMSSGFGVQAGIFCAYKNKISLSGWTDSYQMILKNDSPPHSEPEIIDPKGTNLKGDDSNSILNASTVKIELRLSEHLFLSSEYTSYIRSTHYDYFDNVFSWTSEGRIMLTCKF